MSDSDDEFDKRHKAMLHKAIDRGYDSASSASTRSTSRIRHDYPGWK